MDADLGAALRGITHGAGTFVAVGAGGTLMTSTNTTEWVSRSSGSTGELFGVVSTNSTQRFYRLVAP